VVVLARTRNALTRSRPRYVAFALAGACIFASALSTPATAQEVLTVPYSAKTDLRALAKTHFGNADLWPEILKASGVTAVTELKPGQTLRIPVGTIRAAQKALDLSLVRIQDANEAGAQVFAPELISAAINYRDEALDKSVEGAWEQTLTLATQSTTSAGKAIEVSRANRDQSAEARLSDRQGRVEGQRPAELAWSDRRLNSVLIEEERIRTLSSSTAQVTFRDASRLRLNANSQAVIQRLRVDPLSRREEAKVNLIAGDFYALLSGSSQRKRFNVELKDVDAKIDSGNFWVRHEEGSAKFTNYDDAPVKIASRGDEVTLGRNEGTIIGKGEKAGKKVSVLPAPIPGAPAPDAVLYETQATLKWNEVKGAKGYWIEIASDPSFNAMVESRWGLESPQARTKKLKPGIYSWRVAALDQFGLPGRRSTTLRFEVRNDTTPPFLRIEGPLEGSIVRRASLEITGETEPGVKVVVAGAGARVDKNGRFAAAYTAREGDNKISILATDPAGNTSTKTLKLVHMPDRVAELRFDAEIVRAGDNHFVTNGEAITLSGTTKAVSKIVITDASGTERGSAKSGEDGRFRLNVPVKGTAEPLDVTVVAPSGHRSAARITVSADRTPPAIKFDKRLPRLTGASELVLAGTTDADAALTINGKAQELDKGRFKTMLKLGEGANKIQITAVDRAGNVTAQTRVVRVDRVAPELVRHGLSVNVKGGAGVLTIEVIAKDTSGLAKVAPFDVRAGNEDYSGYLRYNRATRSYTGILEVPAGIAKAARLVAVELQDDARNKKKFVLN